jgi:antitoxin (DNA-binding transcriptional repressor) of toxin-antitoxin stability system
MVLAMKTISVRDIRLHWPKAEQALRREGELVVTRDGAPVARLLPFEAPAVRAPQFDGAAHLGWLSSFWKGKRLERSTDEWLDEDREE